MKILLISANQEVFPDPVFPLGAAYVADAARARGHDVRVLDLMFVPRTRDALSRALSENPPFEAVALSLRNLDNAAYPLTKSYLPSYISLVKYIKERLPGVPVIVGGSAFSLMPDLLLDALGADYGISGEGEIGFPLLLDALETGQPLACVPGAVFRTAPGMPPVVVPPDLGDRSPRTAPFPERDLFAPRTYLKRGGMANVQTKRGCVFRCKYCTYPLLEGGSFRLRPPDDVANEISELVRRHRIHSFFIVDSIFNLPPEHAEAVCDKLIARNLRIRWSCYATPSGMTFALLEKMKAAGCDGIELGTDSAESGMLAGLGKSFSVGQVQNVSRWCRDLGIGVCHTLIFGGPGETPDTVRETCRTIDETYPTAVVAMAGIRVYPGTPLADIAESRGLVPERKRYLDPLFFLEDGLDPFLVEYLTVFARKRGNWILPGIVPPLEPTTQRLIRLSGYRRPLWHLLRFGLFKDRIYRDR
jgi:radical SAM superfamily enzyme YgiQ (UPF0313 family)